LKCRERERERDVIKHKINGVTFELFLDCIRFGKSPINKKQDIFFTKNYTGSSE